MIDPNIALSYRPQVQAQSPIDAFGQAMALRSQANRQTLQGQEIAQNALQMNTAAALNQAIAANTTSNPDGTVKVDHDGVQKAMADAGFANAGQQYANAQKQTDLTLGKLTSDQLLQKAAIQKQVNDSLSAVLTITDPNERQAMWTQKRADAIQNFKADPNGIPQQVPDDATLKTYQQLGMDSYQRMMSQIAGKQADTAALREADNAKRVNAYYEWMMNRGSMDRYRFTNQYDKDNHPIILDTQGGKVFTDTNVTGAPWAAPGTGAGTRSVTPDAQLTENRANQIDYEKNQQAEITASQQRNALDSALKNGKVYVYANGRTVPFSSMKTADGKSPLSADDIAAFQQEMQQRKVGLERSVENAVANKNNALERNHQTPQVSTEKAVAGYHKSWGYPDQQPGTAGAGNPAAADTTDTASSGRSQPRAALGDTTPAYTGKVFQADPTGKSQFKVNQFAYDKAGNQVKVLGYTQDGKVITGR